MPVSNRFTIAELIALDLPPDSPEDVQDRPDVHLDEYVRTLKYSQVRRFVFTHPSGKTYAVEYEAPVDAGDFEVGADGIENFGWGRHVIAVQVERRTVAVQRWMPVHEDTGTDPDAGAEPVRKHLTAMYLECGVQDADAPDYAIETVAQAAREFAVLLDEEHPKAAAALRAHAKDLMTSAK